ncbi:MAG TPA: type I DNA topoisomerase [Acidimicrobiales bacterium]|jgi:DNA topoisomerase I|nr:type I DNA topoisomerase [Acidimicrobiales bacterium]
MPQTLVIVESPAKAKKISEYLGRDYVVMASIGHVRDLETKGLAVDVDNHFKPTYAVYDNKKKVISELRAALKDADQLLLATDEDREGEAISWHLVEVLKPRVPVRRMVFHEITRPAIERAVQESRDIDYRLVDAQESRRIVDRLFGYPVSEVCWRKIRQGLSAGRVQSPAVRLVVERERERMAFVSAGYSSLTATFPTDPSFAAKLHSVDGVRVAAATKDFDSLGNPTGGVLVLDEAAATSLADSLAESSFSVASVDTTAKSLSPKAPFITSSLQQVGGSRLSMSAQQVMRVAQGLYERGYITYMRTDSTTLSETAIAAARSQIAQRYGNEYLPDAPRHYASRSKNAQEAHEAIRPAGEVFRTPEEVRGELSGADFRLYELIWQRTVASQMVNARAQDVTVTINATASDGRATGWRSSGRTILFPGWMAVYGFAGEDADAGDDATARLPQLAEGDALPAPEVTADSHRTTPPARYTEAQLVKALEEKGIGRPSTYASIMGTIQDRGYVWKKGQALVPTSDAFAVVNLLEGHFGELVDYDFTARMESDLDEIAGGRQEREPWLTKFWFGNGTAGLKDLCATALEKADPAAVNAIPIGADADGEVIVVRNGKYGPYVKRGDDTASLPPDIPLDELTVERALELLAAPKGDEPIGHDPESALPVYVKNGRFGPYVQLGDAETLPPKQKPRMASLFKTMTPESVTVDVAMQLLSLPRVVGVDPESGDEITAQNGRYGPYLKKGNDSRSIETEEQLFTITLEEALAIYSQPKTYGRQRAAAKPPLRDLGIDPAVEKPVVIKEGRFGPYITDGEYNVTVPRGETPEDITAERAFELLADKRAAGPAKKAGRKKAAAPKKAAAKKAAKKATGAKKAAKRKPPAD